MTKVLKVDYPFLLGFDLSNANGYNEYQEYMNLLMSSLEPYVFDGQDIESATYDELELQKALHCLKE